LAEATPVTKKQARTFKERQASAFARRSRQELLENAPLFVNWDYSNWRLIWQSIRHAMIGEVEIKKHGQMYLPKSEAMDDDQYAAYLDRAVFYNMVYRTVTGLTGSIFRRDPRLLKPGAKLKKLAKRISKDGLSLNVFSKVVAQEMLSVGRYGVLADKTNSESITAQPYLAGYTCENILDWTTTEIDGRDEYDYILLREFKVDRRLFHFEGDEAKPNVNYGQLFTCYRILRLLWNDEDNRWEYTQEYYARDDEDANLTEDPDVFLPLVYGVPMKRIPFRFFNATTNLPDIEKPPVLDILTLNMSHYKTYAQLEHGRYYTANPVYTVSGGQEDDEYHIGPSVVWEIGSGEKAEILEFSGQGLKSLETALSTKEGQVASLGGRLLGDSSSAGQSDNQIKLKDRNEQSLLLNVTTVLNENFTDLLRIIGEWMNEAVDETMEFRVNQDFLLDQAAAREFRAVAMMYKDGQLPIEVFYEYMLKADVIPEYVDIDTFKNMLNDSEQFPNNPDFDARRDGFPTAQQQRSDELARDLDDNETGRVETQIDGDQDLQDTQNDHDAEQAVEDRKTQVKVAKETPKIAPVPNTAKQAMSKDGVVKPVAPKPANK
jgi:hypothetical protein